MVFWGKKSDGFDWHKHVRTTIKLKREARKQKLDGAVDVAVGGIKGAGKAGVEASFSLLDRVNRVIAAPIVWVGRGIGATLGLVSSLAARPLEPIGRLTERQGVAPMLALTAVVTGLLGLGRAGVEGFDAIALALTGCSVALLVGLIAPGLIAGRGPEGLKAIGAQMTSLWKRLPGTGGLPIPAQRGITASLLVVLLAGGGWLGARAISGMTGATMPAIPGFARPVAEGTASATRGDGLRLNGQALKLTGIEAPELEQDCGGKGREGRWRCGTAAREQLNALVRAKKVRCELGSASAGQPIPATCTIGTQDIAAEMVSRGHVFATAGLFSSYGRHEQDARNAGRGIWRGTAERPDVFRNRLWEAATKSAPQGCPIKGQITRNDRVYVVPWSAGYTRARVRTDRGERWFCTEAEAQAAGWRPASARRDG